jgi:tRNA(Ile)-lysidine synthase
VLVVEPEAQGFPLTQIFSKLNNLDRIAVAVSGGSDSVAMLCMVHTWARPSLRIDVLTVDHGLRLEAAAEAKQVARWCAELGVSHTVLKWNGPKPSSGVQAKARQARYDLMTGWCLANGVDALLTAHTADDQAETVLMRSARTGSVKSLAGIWPERDWNGIRLLRPLLGLHREEMRGFLRQRNQDWIDDPSNLDSKYERVRIRQSLGGETRGLAELAENAQIETRMIVKAAEKWAGENFELHALGYLEFAKLAFEPQPATIQDEILLQAIKLVGVDLQPELRERQNLLHWLAAEGGSRRALAGLIFVKRKLSILVGREPGRISTEAVMIPNAGETVWDHRFGVTGPAGAKIVAAGRIPGLSRKKQVPAFIQAGLPAVLTAEGQICVPNLEIGAGATCYFVRY